MLIHEGQCKQSVLWEFGGEKIIFQKGQLKEFMEKLGLRWNVSDG